MPPKVKKLRIKPSPRRESERMKTRSASAASTPTTATSASSAGDTIEVAQKSSDDRVESMSDAPAVSVNGTATVTGESFREVEAQAAEPVQENGGDDQEKEDVDDTVTEYDFSNEKDSGFEDDEDENPRGIFKDTLHEVIEISSDDGAPQESFALDPHPWRSMNRPQRREREKMYCEQLARPLEGDWERAESYQENLDQEMEDYIKDHKLQDWLIGVQRAQRGFDRMIDRKKYRGFGVPIFQEQILRQIGVQPPMQPAMQPPPLAPPGHHRSQAPHGHHQMPQQMPHHPIPNQMPPPHMMPQGAVPYGPPGAQMPPPVVYQPMQQVGVDVNGNAVYQPVHQPHPQPTPNPLAMPPPKRTASHPQAPQQRASVGSAGSVMQPTPEQGRRKRQKWESQATTAASVTNTNASLVPPYGARGRPPADATPALRTGNSYKFGSLEPGVLPWNRDIDFKTTANGAHWDDSIYTPVTMDLMEKVRERNSEIVARIDAEDVVKQRQARLNGPGHGNAKWHRKEPDDSEVGANGRPLTPNAHGFDYTTDADKYRARALAKTSAGNGIGLPAKPTVGDLMAGAESGNINMDHLNGINIRWNPAKKGITPALQQVVFSIRDSMLTRDQLMQTPILTDRAAECLIDFCPDLLCHDTLLRITSETSLGPKRVRDRMCLNGNYVDKSSITKRIGTALGKKQQVKGVDEQTVAAGDALYKKNKADYAEYQAFFGNGLSHKSEAGQKGKGKRNGTEDVDTSAVESRPSSSGSDGSVVVLNSGTMERITTRSSLNKGKGKAKTTQIIQVDGADDEAVESRPSSSDSEGGVLVGATETISTRASGKGKARVSQTMQLDGAADEDDEKEEMDVVEGAQRKELDEVSLQSDGELDRLVDDLS